MSRETFIDLAIERGKTGEEINSSLGRLGYDPLSRAEIQQINEGSYGLNFGQRFAKGIGDMTKGGATMIGQGLYTLGHLDTEGKKVANKVGNYLSSNPSIIGDLTNLALSPYNVDLPKLATQSPVESVKDIAVGAYNNPAYALLDTLPFTSSAIGKGVAKGVSKLNKILPEGNLKNLTRGLTEEGRKTNQILSESRAATADTIEKLKRQSLRLQQASPEDLAIAIKNIESPTKGAWVGNEAQLNLTKELRDMVKGVNESLVRSGANPETLKTAAVNQYIVRNLGTDTPLATVERALKDKKFALENGLEPQKLKALEEEGTRLYNKDLIQPFKHSTDADMVREGLVEESLKKQRSANAKLYGTQSYEDLAKGFIKDGYTSTINKLRTTEGAMGAIKAMAEEVGRKVDDVLPELRKDEVLVSPRLLNEKFGTSIANGEDILGDINSLSRGLNKAERAKYADDLYIFNKEDIEALKKAYNPRSGLVGNLGNIAKMGVLATPRYIAGNALTNLMIAPITGTTIRDYLDVIKNPKLLPDALKRSTSYSGYLGERLPLKASYGDVYKELTKDIAEGDFSRKLEATNMAANYPIFRMAQATETLQRSAEFMNQAKKYAQEMGKTIEEVLEEARKNGGNNKTFREINFRVQKYLGDYLGRNYYLPQLMQSGLEVAAPFYRPLTQGVRQFYNAASDYPIGMQLAYRQPAIAANTNAEQIAQETGTDRDPVYGGYPIQERSGRLAGKVIYSPYHAYSPVGELMKDPVGTISGNTFGMAFWNPLMGKNRFGDTAKLPNAMESFDGKLILLDNNGNPTGVQLENNVEARLRTIGGQFAQQFVAPITQANSYILPLLSLATRQGYRSPADTSLFGQVGDLRIPFISESNIGARPKEGIDETLLPLLGGTIRSTYKEKTGEVVGKDYRRYGSEMRKRLNRMKWER